MARGGRKTGAFAVIAVSIVLGVGVAWLASRMLTAHPPHYSTGPSEFHWDDAGRRHLAQVVSRAPFKVQITPGSGCDQPPCSITFGASVSGGAEPPLRYAWSGCSVGTEAWITCTALEYDFLTAGVVVTDAQGRSERAAISVRPRNVTVFYAMDRRPDRSRDGIAFTGERNDDAPEPLSFGVSTVSMPEGHVPGGMERPSIWQLSFSEDPDDHIAISSVSARTEDSFFENLASRVGQSSASEAFIFVHGFNVDFESAVRRTAQLAWDLKFAGAPILFSWPSRGGFEDYAGDVASATWAKDDFIRFIRDVHARSGAKTIFLIAHSMGAYAVTGALEKVAAGQGAGAPRFKEIILAAPDIDAGVFKRLAPQIRTTTDRITMYAASGDAALKISKGIRRFDRAGESGSKLVVVDSVETIDASDVVDEGTDPLAHSYFASSRSVLADISAVLRGGLPPGSRLWLEGRRQGSLPYWVFLGSPWPVRVLMFGGFIGAILGAVIAWRRSLPPESGATS